MAMAEAAKPETTIMIIGPGPVGHYGEIRFQRGDLFHQVRVSADLAASLIAQRKRQLPVGDERFGILFSDGSMTILEPGLTLAQAKRERYFGDRDDKMVRVRMPPYEVLDESADG